VEDATKSTSPKNQFEIEGYRIYVDNGYLYVVKGKQLHHKLEDGEIVIVQSPTEEYFYFRSDAFQQLLDKYGLTRVINKEPRVAIPARFSVKPNVIDAYQIVTDGAVELKPYKHGTQTVTHNGSEVNVLSLDIRIPSDHVIITDATYVVFQQLAIKHNPHTEVGQNRVVYQTRQVITKTNPFEMRELLDVAASVLDQAVVDILGLQFDAPETADIVSDRAITYVDATWR
jgi:hypothetical protein